MDFDMRAHGVIAWASLGPASSQWNLIEEPAKTAYLLGLGIPLERAASTVLLAVPESKAPWPTY